MPQRTLLLVQLFAHLFENCCRLISWMHTNTGSKWALILNCPPKSRYQGPCLHSLRLELTPIHSSSIHTGPPPAGSLPSLTTQGKLSASSVRLATSGWTSITSLSTGSHYNLSYPRPNKMVQNTDGELQSSCLSIAMHQEVLNDLVKL